MTTLISNPVFTSLNRQINHWSQAASRLAAFDQLASGIAWQGIEQNLGLLLKQTLQKSIQYVTERAKQLSMQLESATDKPDTLRSLKQGLIQLRDQYIKAEETIHFYTIAVNSRTTPNIAALLRACDILCIRSMQALLQPLGKPTPYVLTYIEKGVGASILKAGLRLWDGNISSVAAIKVTQHNLFRPTAIIHETGHQIAHILNWNTELAMALSSKLNSHPEVVRSVFASWATEIAADAFAFVHTGYASVAALHDVVSGSPQSIFAYHANDPHPIGYIRVLLNIEKCRQFYGKGPWDDLESAFKNDYNIDLANFPSTPLIRMCMEALPDAARVILKSSYRAFGNCSLSQLIDPELVSPQSLRKLEITAGPALYTSHAWIWKECLRLLADNGYHIALGKGDLASLYKRQEEYMIKLGFSIESN
jgi:hypothetical protein